ncbi:hypothetical protein [Chitinophaga sp. CF418]|nr:hypothetical protein [Chitinophaga sp. CF418]SHN33611.1 hypothetical protein SAMN05216311_109187 [Chitinophaga sp. CF418]
MKNKLRRIRVEDNEYLYVISDKYENGTSTLTIRVFLTSTGWTGKNKQA